MSRPFPSMESPIDEPKKRSILISATCVGAILVVGLVASWIFLGRAVFEKLASDWMMPLGVLTIVLMVLVVHAMRVRRWRDGMLLLVVLLSLGVSGNGLVAEELMMMLEAKYADIDPLTVQPLDHLVVLGGATSETTAGGVQVTASGDRIVMTARMYHSGRVRQIICTGARTQGLSANRLDEAEQTERILVGLGVPKGAIRRLGGRNTSEEMASIAKSVGDTKVGILTSAWHLSRALRLAKAQGIRAVPIPSDFATHPRDATFPLGTKLRYCIPNAQALFMNTRAIHEFLASLVGR